MDTILDVSKQLHEAPALRLLGYYNTLSSGEELQQLALEYEANDAVSAQGYFVDGVLRGILIVEKKEDGQSDVLGVSVDPKFRDRGIGRILIQYVFAKMSGEMLVAVTDDFTVGFFRRCGFTVREMWESQMGVNKYLCMLYEEGYPGVVGK